MSGGHFFQISQIEEEIQSILDNQGKEKDKDELRCYSSEYLKEYPEERFNPTYPEEVQKVFKDGIKALKIAHIYAQRIDWYLSGDDGEESLFERLAEELNEVID